ncbi:MAG: DUF3373 domain-containing protein [Helicobacteraceae bacterium]|jgi:hypothetical protein|nr:DUF3373 domain-containing protein [Helicobacteraceae bacterium]
MIRKTALAALLLSAAFGNDEIEALKTEIARLKSDLGEVRKQSAQDNLKFGVDLRTAIDTIRYEFADGGVAKNDDLLSTRLWLNMKYQPQSDIAFFGQLSYNKLYGDSANRAQTNTAARFSDFDWVVNEASSDNTLKVRQAYFLHNGTLGDLGYTASFGRRPSTGGSPLHYREDDAAQSPLSQMINAEFDGASFQLDLSKAAGIAGMYAKLCLGRGLTNAKPRFSQDGADYAADKSQTHKDDIDMAGLIFQPYYDGQYRVVTQFIRAVNLIGYEFNASGSPEAGFRDFGAINAASIAYVQEGVGEFINDFLDNTKLFVSYSISQSDPSGSMRMLGSANRKIGESWYVGAQFPAFWSDTGAIGLEYNQGSKYWRSFTYAEDTAIGSKLAARGRAYEIYYTQPLIGQVLSFQARYTYIDYDYTGSNAFFGEEGAPVKISDRSSAVDKASDLRFYIRYRY